MTKKVWTFSPASRKGKKITDAEKQRISDFFQPLIDEFKAKIKPPENKDWNYITDIYSKWYQNYFYICEKYKSEAENRLQDEWEDNVVRLKYIGKDEFDFSYFRHTGKWELVSVGLSLEGCKEMIMENPSFQPMVF
jgi:hypothetical protein